MEECILPDINDWKFISHSTQAHPEKIVIDIYVVYDQCSDFYKCGGDIQIDIMAHPFDFIILYGFFLKRNTCLLYKV